MKKKVTLGEVKKVMIADLTKNYERVVKEVAKAKTSIAIDDIACCHTLSARVDRMLNKLMDQEDEQ